MIDAPVDESARRHAIHSAGSVLVQAPAGSGKTTLLAQRYLRLLAGVDAPERILALTFTRRAAQEMRERVLRALQAGGFAECPAGIHEDTWRLGRDARLRMRAAGLDLERHPSRLRIETIDAFNAWLAAQLPVTAGAGSRQNLTDAPAALYAEAARRALAYDEPDHFGAAVERVLALDDQRWQALVELIAGMLPSRERWLPLLAGDLQATGLDAEQLRDVRRRLDEDLELLVTRVLAGACEAIGTERLQSLSRLMHAAAVRMVEPGPYAPAWRTVAAPPRADASDLPRWRSIAAVLLTAERAYRKRLTKNEGFPPNSPDKAPLADLIAEFERSPAVLRALHEIRGLPEPHYDDAQWGRVREVAQVLVLATAQLQQVFRERGTVDFTAVSMGALRALGTPSAPTDLGLRLDYRLQHILIDEFQDTSGAQLDLLKLLTAGWQRGDGRTIFCVGDPMQSIYGFRQAEVRAFLELAEEGVGDVTFDVERLRSNFRSAAPLVDWINRCFADILPRRDDRARGAIAFRPSESALRGKSDAEPEVRLCGYASRREEADAIADLVERRCARHPAWRVAILVRARAHARDIAASLHARGVAFRAVDIEPLQDRPVVRDLVTLVCALLHLGDRRAWLALLRAPWTGLVLADLLHLARAAPVIWAGLTDDAVLSGLTADGRARCERLRGILDAAFAQRAQSTIARWVERTWLALGGLAGLTDPEDLGHADRFFAKLRSLEEAGLPDAAELADAFGDLYAEQRGAAQVEIMTIHKAKGLEFDLVVVPALDRQLPAGRDELLLSHEFARAGRGGLVMAARPGVGGEPDSLFEFLRRRARDAASLEAQRLLYVACTRAKWQLHLTATLDVDQDTDDSPGDGAPAPRHAPHAASLLAVLWPVVGSEFIRPAAAEGAPSAAAASAPMRGGPLRRIPSGWVGGREVAAAAGAAQPGIGEPRPETPVFDWAGETARRVGSLVHAELQALDLDRSDAARVRAREPQFRRWLALHGVPAERLAEAGARVTSALLAVHGDPRARWILAKEHRAAFREHALSGSGHSGVTRVVFDRTFIDGGGVRWVIDYKTSDHVGGGLEEFLDREVERYRPQLHRYAEIARKLGPEPVRVGLYFPLMRAWREWAP